MKKVMKFISLCLVGILLFGTVFNTSNASVAPDKDYDTNEVVSDTNGNNEIFETNKEIMPRFSYRVVTKNGNLNVRKGPGTNYGIKGAVAKGSIVECSFEQPGNVANTNWLYGSGIDVNSGKRITGYMCSDYLDCITID